MKPHTVTTTQARSPDRDQTACKLTAERLADHASHIIATAKRAPGSARVSLRLHRSETDLTHTKLEAGLVDTAVGLLVVRAIQIRGKYAQHGTRVRALSALRMTVGQSD